ncbi:MAG: hypothetical protein V1745_01490 [Patescibacteria group bacterium]
MNATAKKFTRFHTTSGAPPFLGRIIRDIRKTAKRVRLDKNVIRSCCVKAGGSFYQDKGKSDDAFRYLANEHVIVQDADGSLLFDEERAIHVAECASAHRNPDPPAPPTQRIVELKRLAEQRERLAATRTDVEPTTERAPMPPTSDPPASLSVMTAPGVKMETAKPFEPDPVSTPTVESIMPVDEMCPIPASPRFVLFLTPVELDIWETLHIQQEKVADSRRIPVPEDPEKLHEAWASLELKRKTTPEEYEEALGRFKDTGILNDLGPSGNGHRACVLSIVPEMYHIIRIVERTPMELAKEYVACIRSLQAGEFDAPRMRAGSFNALFEWVRKHHQALHPRTVYTKLIGFRPRRPTDGIGILVPYEDILLRSVRGFESVTIVTTDRPLMRHRSGIVRDKKRKTAGQPSTDGKPEGSLPVTEDDLDRLAEELQRRMEEVQRELRGIEIKKRKRLENRRAEFIRQAEEHEQQARDLRREAADVDASLGLLKLGKKR